MSALNGDKSRFHRVRKQKIARRLRKQAMLKALGEKNRSAQPASRAQSKAVSE